MVSFSSFLNELSSLFLHGGGGGGDLSGEGKGEDF